MQTTELEKPQSRHKHRTKAASTCGTSPHPPHPHLAYHSTGVQHVQLPQEPQTQECVLGLQPGASAAKLLAGPHKASRFSLESWPPLLVWTSSLESGRHRA